jgi:hypothetical protein
MKTEIRPIDNASKGKEAIQERRILRSVTATSLLAVAASKEVAVSV